MLPNSCFKHCHFLVKLWTSFPADDLAPYLTEKKESVIHISSSPSSPFSSANVCSSISSFCLSAFFPKLTILLLYFSCSPLIFHPVYNPLPYLHQWMVFTPYSTLSTIWTILTLMCNSLYWPTLSHGSCVVLSLFLPHLDFGSHSQHNYLGRPLMISP